MIPESAWPTTPNTVKHYVDGSTTYALTFQLSFANVYFISLQCSSYSYDHYTSYVSGDRQGGRALFTGPSTVPSHTDVAGFTQTLYSVHARLSNYNFLGYVLIGSSIVQQLPYLPDHEKLTWIDRHYEAGVDRGVLYIGSVPGIAWNGLTDITEKSVGGEVTSYYIDGVKYLDLTTTEEFEATIEALTYPDEFAPCEGTRDLGHGLYTDQDTRSSFGMSYVTRGDGDNYKIHLVYNALATMSDRAYLSESDSVNVLNFSWDISTHPAAFVDRRSISHIIIDSTSEYIAEVENIIYGNGLNTPRLPSVSELIELFNYTTLYPLLTSPVYVTGFAEEILIKNNPEALVTGFAGEVLIVNNPEALVTGFASEVLIVNGPDALVTGFSTQVLITNPLINLLTANQWSIETDTSGFGNLSAYVGLFQSTAHATVGSYSLIYRPTAAASGSWTTIPRISIVAGQSYNVSSKFFKEYGGQYIRLGLIWYNSSGTEISRNVSSDLTSTLSNTAFDITVNYTAPTGAVTCEVLFQTSNVGAVAYAMYFDQIGLYQTSITDPVFVAP